MTAPSDTIVALSSGRPPAAIAVVRASGPDAIAALERLARRPVEPRRASLVALRDPANGQLIDRALVLVFPGPDSATGEDVVEFQCHGGRAVVERLISTLVAQPKLRPAEPGEFTRRALFNGRIDLTEAEGLADLLEAETESQRRAAIRAAEGGLRRQIESWRNALVDLSAQAEAAIDYVGEDETEIDASALARGAGEVAGEIEQWLQNPRAERLRDGFRVVLGGSPNSGKSSLFNALLDDDRAIVTDVPGTTRDSIEAAVAFDGMPIVLVDTAGIRDSADEVERLGIARSQRELDTAGLILWLDDEPPPDRPTVLWLYPRTDQPGRDSIPPGRLGVSSRTGAGLKELWARIGQAARDWLPAEDVIALNARQAALLEETLNALRAMPSNDPVLLAESLRAAREALDKITGARGIEDMLDALFGRFCLGK